MISYWQTNEKTAFELSSSIGNDRACRDHQQASQDIQIDLLKEKSISLYMIKQPFHKKGFHIGVRSARIYLIVKTF